MLLSYLAILIFIIFAVFIGIAAVFIGYFLSPKQPYEAKLAAYECGSLPESDTELPFDVRYYLVAILFIIFDLETAFLFPWAVAFRELGSKGVWAMALFVTLLLLGFIYEWRKGALEWE